MVVEEETVAGNKREIRRVVVAAITPINIARMVAAIGWVYLAVILLTVDRQATVTVHVPHWQWQLVLTQARVGGVMGALVALELVLVAIRFVRFTLPRLMGRPTK